MAAKTQDAAGEGMVCPSCGSPKVVPTRGNAVGATMDCTVCGRDFTPAAPRETALAAPTGETVPGLWDVMVSMALKPRQVCVSATDEAQVAALLAARVAAPSAPQELCGMCAEHRKVVMDGCVHCATARVAARRAASQEPRGEPSAWAHAAVESAKQEVAEAYDAGGERARDALYKTLDLIFTRKLGRGFDPECESIACAVECALDAARASEPRGRE